MNPTDMPDVMAVVSSSARWLAYWALATIGIVPRPSRLTTWPTWQPVQWQGQASRSSTRAVSTNLATLLNFEVEALGTLQVSIVCMYIIVRYARAKCPPSGNKAVIIIIISQMPCTLGQRSPVVKSSRPCSHTVSTSFCFIGRCCNLLIMCPSCTDLLVQWPWKNGSSSATT